MKKVFLLFIISFSILGYSQNPIQTNITDYKVGLHEDNFKRLNPDNLDFLENKKRDLNPNQKNKMNSQSFERKLIVNEEVSYRLDSLETISFDTGGVNSKYEYSFDENGNQTLYIQYNWDSESQSLVPYSKSESTYDENGNRTLFIQYIWDSVIEVFYEFSKEMKSYDEFGYVLDYEIHNWIQELNQMKPVNKTVYSTLSETETNLVREGIIYEYDTNFNTWNELEGEEFKSYFYYTKTSSLSTNSVELNSFSIYPNPTKGYLKINSSESLINPFFELYDIKGSKIFSKPFNFSEPIDVNGLKPSIYLYKIIDGNEVKQSGKVIKE